ncbi:hypothetical protein C2S53_013889 [Perilla frutescens var. hirtella]|uniref:GAG-pre-integrase domain-containing protein n=1 Tax=Perilla frutescens var. hirtella TaxID=608512 RepID=A0AAD4IMH6_PERFH|nr:hypothetical protein C2S53_013889 [Perilla frutescens var. hirtella]
MDIEAAMHTMTLSPPDVNWYMDTGATSHMTSMHGITIGNGHSIPICGSGHTSLPHPNPPLFLKNFLHVPQLIKNSVSVRKFTTDNYVTVEFDHFGFSVKDFKIGTHLMRCDSSGYLYPITTYISSPLFIVLASTIWHDRLGHPVDVVSDTLRLNKYFDCNRTRSLSICHSCVLGKHTKLPFVPSTVSYFHAI